jgi:hypothetical protein
VGGGVLLDEIINLLAGRNAEQEDKGGQREIGNLFHKQGFELRGWDGWYEGMEEGWSWIYVRCTMAKGFQGGGIDTLKTLTLFI